MNDQSSKSERPGIKWWHPALAAAWIGIALGYLEGATLCTVQAFYQTQYVSLPTIWITPLLYGFVLGLFGLAVALPASRWPRVPAAPLVLFICFFLAATDVLEIAFPEILARYAKVVLAAGIALAALRPLRSRLPRFFLFCRHSIAWLALSIPIGFLLIEGGIRAREAYRTSQLPPASAGTPNVLFIVVDTLRADHLGCHGYRRDTTPTIDALAADSVQFNSAFAASCWTLPSHVSLFTGLDAHRHQIGRHEERLPDDLPTIAGQLRERGYRTGAFTANVFWITHDRVGNGFLHFDDYYHSVADRLLRTMYGRAFERFVMQPLGYENLPARRLAADINRLALDWIDRNPQRPFFAFLNYFDTHDPYLPPQPFRDKFASSRSPGGILNWRLGRSDPELTPQQHQSEIDAHDGGIAYVDDQIRRLLEALKDRGVLDNTLLIVTSDHGESFQEHGYYLHGHSLYREQIHVPLILHWPQHIPAGVVIEQPVTNTSLPATIMELLGRDPHPFTAPSLVTLWTEPPESWPYPQAATQQKNWAPEGSPAEVGALRCVMTPRWHLIQHESLSPELYQWRRDPKEISNVVDAPQSPPELGELQRLLSE